MATLRAPVAFNKVASGDPIVDALQDRVSESVRSLVQAIVDMRSLRIFANNAAAVVAGLAPGAFYRTGADPDVVCVVH